MAVRNSHLQQLRPWAIVDAQVHISAPHCNEFPWLPSAREDLPADVQRRFADPTSSAEHLIALMDAEGVDFAVLASRGVVYGSDPAYAFAAAERFPGRFGVVGAFYPDMAEGPAMAEAFLDREHALGIRMVLPAPGAERITDAACRAILAASEAGGVPFFAHLTHHPGRVADLLEIADAFPDLTIVVDHLGLHSLEEPSREADLATLDRLAGRGNVAVKWSGAAALSNTGYPFADLWPSLERLLTAFGPDRIMWGSDITGNFARMSYREAIDHVAASDRLSAEDKAMILGRTARTLLGKRGKSQHGDARQVEHQDARGEQV